MCIVTVLSHGLRSGGGVGDVLRKPSKEVGVCVCVCVLDARPPCAEPVFYMKWRFYKVSLQLCCLRLGSELNLRIDFHEFRLNL